MAAETLPQPDPRSGWLVLTASARGASHKVNGAPNQDSVATFRAGAAGSVTAVADGHGHSRHHRSARGSRLAVSVGCEAGVELAALLDPQADATTGQQADLATRASQLADLIRAITVPDIVRRWRAAVLADVAANPFTAEEQELRRPGDDPTIAYGSTLILAVAVDRWLALAQIGDGDVVGVRADGGATLPVPVDPQLDGLLTTSLCAVGAESDFRVAVLDVTQHALLAVMLATDGYGNAQLADPWASAFSRDLAQLLAERDETWLASQLPVWAAKCASAEGSADDTTVALLLTPAARRLPPGGVTGIRPPAGAPVPGDEEITVPAGIYSQTLPNAVIPAAPGPAAPGPAAPPEQQPTQATTVQQELPRQPRRPGAA